MKALITALSFALTLIAYGQYATEITVSKNGDGDFESIQQAICATKSFPDRQVTIYIKKGVYKEKVSVFAWNTNLRIIGEDRDSTIISWGDHFKKINLGRNSTFHTYTFQIDANDVSIENLTIENTAGRVGQAVALHVDGDRVIIKNCSLKGNQDTIYAAGENNRHYFKNCYIEGTVDFIFGGSTAIFEGCEIKSLANGYITAASTPRSVDYGFVFFNCKLTGSNEATKVLLGRPWRPYAKTAFISCEIGNHIEPQGWNNWSSEEKEKTVCYAEFGNMGPGAKTDERVKWAKMLSKKEAAQYRLENVFGDWNP
ncbi:MAG: pectinesterase family protein [Cyclobacteriaceae bacterium]